MCVTSPTEFELCHRDWGSASDMVEDDFSLWPRTMDRLHSILRDEVEGRLLPFEVENAIDGLYREVYSGLTSMGCGYFWGYCECYRGIR